MELHEVSYFWVGFDLLGGFCGSSPGGVVPRWFSSSSFPRVPSMFGRVASLLVTDETFVVTHMFSSFTGREIDPVNVHGVGVSGGTSKFHHLGGWNIAVASSSELPESYHILIELSCLIEPLFPFPTSLFLFSWEGSSGHHDGELVGCPSLGGIHQDTVKVGSTAGLGQSEGNGILIKVTIELVHV